MKNYAVYCKKMPYNGHGDKFLYKLTNPLDIDGIDDPVQYIIVSSVTFEGEDETVIFPSNKDGKPLSLKGIYSEPGLDPDSAIKNAGWEVYCG